MTDERRYISGRSLGKQLCEVFGLDANTIRSLKVNCPTDDVATVDVEYLFRLDDATALSDTLKKHRAVPEPEWRTFRLAPADLDADAST